MNQYQSGPTGELRTLRMQGSNANCQLHVFNVVV